MLLLPIVWPSLIGSAQLGLYHRATYSIARPWQAHVSNPQVQAPQEAQDTRESRDSRKRSGISPKESQHRPGVIPRTTERREQRADGRMLLSAAHRATKHTAHRGCDPRGRKQARLRRAFAEGWIKITYSSSDSSPLGKLTSSSSSSAFRLRADMMILGSSRGQLGENGLFAACDGRNCVTERCRAAEGKKGKRKGKG